MPTKERKVSRIVEDDGKLNVVEFVSFMQEIADVNLTILSRLDNLDNNVASLSGETEDFVRKKEFGQFNSEVVKPIEVRVGRLEKWQIKVVSIASVVGAATSMIGGIILQRLASMF